MAVMTGNTYGLSETTTPINFTDNAFVSFGSNAQLLLVTGEHALWAGDAKANGQVRFSGADNDTNSIKDHVLADPGNGFNSVTYTSTGYLQIDINMNGSGRFSGSGNDSNIIKDNVLAHPGNGFNSVTYIINPTVPPGN
ncbi:MAG: hemagglutinin protein, partial [Flavobacteriaceae bacterium]|nr:hemagglutinin protein [Flavobacteriaceae bacterium]